MIHRTIYISAWEIIIGSDYGLATNRRQAIIWTKYGNTASFLLYTHVYAYDSVKFVATQ